MATCHTFDVRTDREYREVMSNSPRQDSVNLTIRVGRKQKREWQEKARQAGMSLTLFICYVCDRTDLKVSLTTKMKDDGPPPRR